MSELANMTVTNVSTGLNISTTGTAGTVQTSSQLMALSGFNLGTALTSSGLSYEVVTLNNEVQKSAPPTIVVQTQYNQFESFSEVDFTVSYTSIPEGTQLEIISTVPAYNVSKRSISGTSNLGLIGNNLGKIDATFTINMWIPAGSSLSNQSDLSINLAYIENTTNGPQKKTVLAKTDIKLAQ